MKYILNRILSRSDRFKNINNAESTSLSERNYPQTLKPIISFEKTSQEPKILIIIILETIAPALS